jgi:cytochrome P450
MTTSKILFNAFDKDFQNDPYPTYERLRREDPIHRSIFNTWVITRYSDADAILKDRRFQVDNLPERLKQKNRCNRPIAYRKIKGLGFCTGVC